jgi:glucose/arabinose dehydrogenase
MLVVGNDSANTLAGGAGNDLIYGFDPNGPQSQVSSISATRVATGLSEPVFAGAPAGDFDHLFVVQKTGLIRVLDLNTQQVSATPFLDVTAQISPAGEGGLIGLAFDPDYAHNGFFYVNLINTSGDTEIRRYHVPTGSPLQADPASATLILRIDQPDGVTNHKAGWLGFGPDGYLYAALGDGGPGGDPNNRAQNPDSLLGKMLRLDVHADAFPVDPTRNYAIPADNPFVSSPAADEIFALGLRNPWRNGFDRGLGTLFIADVGQNVWEEINIGQSGANYGWRTFEGPDSFSPGTPLGPGTLTAPIHFYSHAVGRSVTGGYVYRGESEGLHGDYFFADFVDNKYFTLHFNGTQWVATERTSQIVPNVGTLNSPSSFGEDARGNLYVVDFGGEIFRLTPVVASADQSDTLSGLDGNDMMFGGSGNDTLDGGSGADTLIGGPSSDFLVGGAGADAIIGSTGFDIASWLAETTGLTLNLANQTLNAGSAADDRIADVEAFYLTNSADAFTAGATGLFVYGFGGSDSMVGSAQSDFIDGGPGGDVINAGGSFDYVSYNSSASSVTLNLQAPGNNTGDAAGDAISNAEAFILTEQGDSFTGATNGQNIAFGFGGNDTLIGGFNANNWLFGGDGNDRMVGGGIADLFVGGNGADTISLVDPTPIAGCSVFGHQTGVDAIEISRAAFGLSAGYSVTAGTTFVSGSAPIATVGQPTFFYYTNLGLLYFDPDGTGATAATLLMQFDNIPALGAGDFNLI